MPAKLQWSKVLLTRRWTLGSLVTFDDEGSGLDLQMGRATWDDMGRPDTVTITIEPGEKVAGG